MAQIEIKEGGHGCFRYLCLTRMNRGDRSPIFVISFEEAPELVHQLQAAIRAHTIQQQDQPNA